LRDCRFAAMLSRLSNSRQKKMIKTPGKWTKKAELDEKAVNDAFLYLQ